MTYEQALEIRNKLESEVKQASTELKQFPRTDSGLVLDSVRTSSEYQKAKAAYNASFAKLQSFNKQFVKTFKGKR